MNENKTLTLTANECQWFSIRAAIRERIEDKQKTIISLAILDMHKESKECANEIRFLQDFVENTYYLTDRNQ